MYALHPDLSSLVLTDHAFVVTADVRDDVSRLVGWRSADGTDWQPSRLEGLPTGAGPDVALHRVVAAGSVRVGISGCG